jgi:hypothetical protein
MVNALFPLLMAAGVAIAWRSNPMYSIRRTVRFLALCALAVAVLVGAIIGAVHLSAGMSDDDAGTLIGVTILAGTMFFIWMIVTASTPRPAAIQSGTPLVSVHRAHVRPRLPWLLAVLVAFAVLVLVTREEARDLVLVFGGMFCGLAILLMFTLYIAALGMDRSLTSVESAAWIHWTYEPAAWSAWRDALVARAATQPRSWIWSRDWKRFLGAFLISAVALSALYFASIPVTWILSYVVATGVLTAAAIELTARFETRAPERLRRLLLNAPPETYVGNDGTYSDGVYVEWMTASSYLISATIDERAPRCIDFEFVQIVAGAAGTRRFTQSVLIPPNADDDLRTLQTRLAARCPSATVELARRA